MGWRLRRSFKIAPGVRLNLSRSGVGVSAGVKGMRVGVGPRGAYTSDLVPFLQKNALVRGAEDKDLIPHEAQAITLLGLGFAERGEHATAIEVYERVTRRRKMDQHMAVLRYAYARSLEATGDVRGAVRELRKVTAFDVGIGDANERLKRLETGDSSSQEPSRP